MGKQSFCEKLVWHEGKLIRFEDRPYLPAVYEAECNLVLRCSRQTEKSTFLVNTILYEACTKPGIQMLFVCPREQQARVFSRFRLLAALERSPLLRRTLLGKTARPPQVTNLQFANGSTLFVRAAYHSADSCRGISCSLLLVDEFQDMAAGDLPVLQETLSHARNGRTILTGTPKDISNHLETAFRQSTGNEWMVPCENCHKGVSLDERSLGPAGICCPDCRGPLDRQAGRWVPRNPDSRWGAGFWINHAMVPWVTFDEILDKQRLYDLARFKNEVLGLPTTTGDHVATRPELEACCSQNAMAQSRANVAPQGQANLVLGIDWGGGGTSRTVIVIGYLRSDYRFEVCRFERFAATEDPLRVVAEVAQRCREFRVRWIGVDGGGSGHVFNRMLMNRLKIFHGLFAILYSSSDHEPRQDGCLTKWTVNRSASIGVLYSRIKNEQMIFPRIADCGCFLDEFAAELAEYDDLTRTVRYTHPEGLQDDAVHATNYALLVALRKFNANHGLDDYY